MSGPSSRRAAALGAVLAALSWFIFGTGGTQASAPSQAAAGDVPREAARLLGEWNDLLYGFSYFSPDNDTGDHSTVTPFKTELDASSGVLRWSERSVSKGADMRYSYEFPLSAVRTALATDEFCDGCRKIPQGTAVHSIVIECIGGKSCVRSFVYRYEQANWQLERTDEHSHFRIDCPSENCGALEETLRSLIRLYRAKPTNQARAPEPTLSRRSSAVQHLGDTAALSKVRL